MRIGERTAPVTVRVAIEYVASGNTLTSCVGHYAVDAYPNDCPYVQIFRRELEPIIRGKVNKSIDAFVALKGSFILLPKYPI